MLYQDDSYGRTGLDGVTQALARRDMTLVARGTYLRNTTAVKTALLGIRGARPEAIIVIGAYQPSAVFTQWARKLGVDAVIANISFVGANALAEALGPAGDGVYVSQVVPFPEGDAMPLARRVPGRPRRLDPRLKPGFGSLEGYIAGRLTRRGAPPVSGRSRPAPASSRRLPGSAPSISAASRCATARATTAARTQVFLTVIRGDGSVVPVERHGAMSVAAAPRRPRGRASASRRKLYLAIGGAVALTLAASIVAWFAFVELGQHQRRITREHIPSITDSLRLAGQSTPDRGDRAGADLGDHEAERAAVMATLRQQGTALDGLIARLAEEIAAERSARGGRHACIAEIGSDQRRPVGRARRARQVGGRAARDPLRPVAESRPGGDPPPQPGRDADPAPRRRDALSRDRLPLARDAAPQPPSDALHRPHDPHLRRDVAALRSRPT